MKSLKELYQIGPGPSSSHTLGPQKACLKFKEAYACATNYQAHLYGSLALTGKGHLTDYIIKKTLAPTSCEVHFHYETTTLEHPNTMVLQAYNDTCLLGEWTVFSVGGGAIVIKGEEVINDTKEVYPHQYLDEIKQYCKNKRIRFIDYINECEDIDTYMFTILEQMLQTVEIGLSKEGLLPGKLKLERCAKKLFDIANRMDYEERSKMLISSYAYSAAEENASGGITVTAPTLGSSGVLPALMYYYYNNKGVDKQTLVDSLKVGGLFGNLIKHNATISGAKGGCQAEIGAACSMASAAIAYIQRLNDMQIECAAEVGMEHHLGLTCDPVGGYVMIPCIERNAVAALRSMDNAFLMKHLGNLRKSKVSFDMVVNTMNYTGKKIAVELKETSLGGLASVVPMDENKDIENG
ncbi:MAG: L-serine ammonia-lyase [Erysipelotrichia bacterium]|nr:L-serine ammonia-lyase [Erysipelotrichia bacterium]